MIRKGRYRGSKKPNFSASIDKRPLIAVAVGVFLCCGYSSVYSDMRLPNVYEINRAYILGEYDNVVDEPTPLRIDANKDPRVVFTSCVAHRDQGTSLDALGLDRINDVRMGLLTKALCQMVYGRLMSARAILPLLYESDQEGCHSHYVAMKYAVYLNDVRLLKNIIEQASVLEGCPEFFSYTLRDAEGYYLSSIADNEMLGRFIATWDMVDYSKLGFPGYVYEYFISKRDFESAKRYLEFGIQELGPAQHLLRMDVDLTYLLHGKNEARRRVGELASLYPMYHELRWLALEMDLEELSVTNGDTYARKLAELEVLYGAQPFDLHDMIWISHLLLAHRAWGPLVRILKKIEGDLGPELVGSIDYQVLWSRFYIVEGDREMGVHRLRKVLRDDRYHWHGLWAMFEYAQMEGNLEKAREMLRRLLRVAPYSSSVWVYMSELSNSTGDWEEVEAMYKMASVASKTQYVDRAILELLEWNANAVPLESVVCE